MTSEARFYGEFIGDDWLEIPGYPNARFLAPPPVDPAVVESWPREWPEGWKELGFVTETPLAFTRGPAKGIDDWRWVPLSAYKGES